MTNPATSKIFGLFGVITAFMALLTALIGPPIYAAIFPKPAIEERISDTAVKIRDRVIARLKGAPANGKMSTKPLTSPELPFTISLGLAGLAIIGGCTSFLRREDSRYAYVACGVGTLTLAWSALLLALGALILCIIVFSVFS